MNYLFLTNTPLFHGVREDEIEHLLSCLGAREKTYQKIVVNFYWGNSNIFGHVEKGMIFAENYAAIPGKELLCDVVAAEPCEILFLNLTKLLTTCTSGCSFHQRLIHNLLRISAMKSLNLSSRLLHTAPKSMRDKLLSYLSEQAMVHSNTHFTIPFDRQ